MSQGTKLDVAVIDELEAWFRAQPETPSRQECADHAGISVWAVQEYLLKGRGCVIKKGLRAGHTRKPRKKPNPNGLRIVKLRNCTVDELDYFARDIRKGWDEGLSVNEIAVRIFRTSKLTSRWIKKNIPEAAGMSRGDWIMRGQGKSIRGSSERKEAARLYVEEHLNAAEVGRRLGVEQGVARDWIRSEGVEIESNYHDRMPEDVMKEIAERISATKSQMDNTWTAEQRAKARKNWDVKMAQVREYRTCPVCGDQFYVRKTVKQECCSRSCMSVLRERRYIERNGFSKNQAHMPQRAIKILSTKENLLSYLGDRQVTTTELGDELGCSCTVVLHRFREYGLQDHILWGSSKEENEVGSLLRDWGVFWEKSRYTLPGRYEIDIYVPEQKLGIEFNGDYWHSELVSPSANYHQKKTDIAEAVGVRLIHVWEYEWNDKRKRPIIESMLANAVGMSLERVFARKCEVRGVPVAEQREFLDTNHLQGYCPAKIALGLYQDDDLVSMMTFGKPRFGHKYEWEMLRFCSSLGTSVVGGASKLFKHFVAQESPQSIVTYSSNDKTTGALYPVLGFEQQDNKNSSLAYVWVNFRGSVLSRYQTQMKNETETMHERGYHKITQCGNKVWVWTP